MGWKILSSVRFVGNRGLVGYNSFNGLCQKNVIGGNLVLRVQMTGIDIMTANENRCEGLSA